MKVQLCSTNDDKRKVNKTYTILEEIECNLLYPFDILSPRIEIKYNKNRIKSNYVYISDFERFYFIDNITLSNGNKIIVNLSVDVLTSYKDFINSITCVIERQENLFNNYLIDNMIELRTNKFVENQLIGFIGDSSGSSIVLTVTGGGV